VIGLALLTGLSGAASAQEASPIASPEASPVAVAAWVDSVTIDASITADGDSTSVGVTQGELLEINVAEFEARPFIILQTANTTDTAFWAVLFTAPEGFDAATFTIPETEDALPEGVTPLGSYAVAPQSQTAAIFTDLVPGTYVLASTAGQALSFVVIEPVPIEVPDVFGTPEGTPAS
jgi:hypothetical protein